MAKIISISEAVDLIHEGMTVASAALAHLPLQTAFWRELARNFGSRILPKN